MNITIQEPPEYCEDALTPDGQVLSAAKDTAEPSSSVSLQALQSRCFENLTRLDGMVRRHRVRPRISL